MEHPKSESTLKRHHYSFDIFEANEKGIIVNKKQQYVNDFGFACRYRIEIDGRDIGERAIYYGGRLQQVIQVIK